MQSFPFKPVRPTDLIPAWPASSKIKSIMFKIRAPRARRLAPTGAGVAPAWVKQPGNSSMHQNRRQRIPTLVQYKMSLKAGFDSNTR
jgi:hypothetical protein